MGVRERKLVGDRALRHTGAEGSSCALLELVDRHSEYLAGYPRAESLIAVEPLGDVLAATMNMAHSALVRSRWKPA